jgi:hypothetical protein
LTFAALQGCECPKRLRESQDQAFSFDSLPFKTGSTINLRFSQSRRPRYTNPTHRFDRQVVAIEQMATLGLELRRFQFPRGQCGGLLHLEYLARNRKATLAELQFVKRLLEVDSLIRLHVQAKVPLSDSFLELARSYILMSASNPMALCDRSAQSESVPLAMELEEDSRQIPKEFVESIRFASSHKRHNFDLSGAMTSILESMSDKRLKSPRTERKACASFIYETKISSCMIRSCLAIPHS